MPTKRVIPSLLLRNGRLVKGTRFAEYRDAGNPVTTARAHNAQGADELLLVDIDASPQGRALQADVVREVAAECFMPLAVGGGIRTVDDAHRCMDAGADKLAINTGALDRPGLIDELARIFGSQAVIVSIDISDGEKPNVIDFRTGRPHAATSDLDAWIAEAIDRGSGEIRLMARDREGTRTGFPTAVIEQLREIPVPLIVEGGIGSFEQASKAFLAGADAIGLGTMLVFEDNNIVKVKRALAALGHEMRK
jgi:cyclase